MLYRTNAMSRVIEDTLVRREIAYQVIGGTKFYERAEIKDAIAYLSLLANPYDVVSFARDRQLAAARDRADVARRACSRTPTAIGHVGVAGGRGAERGARPGRGGGQGAAALHGHDGRAARWRARRGAPASAAGAATRGVGRELLEAVLAQSGYVEALEAERTIEAQGRIENLEQLVEVGREFDAAAPSRRATRWTSSCSRSRWSPTPTRAATTRDS